MDKFKIGLLLFLLLNIHVIVLVGAINFTNNGVAHDYGDALTKCILFFEGQRSGKLPPSQRMKWRRDSALRDGSDVGADLVGGYYDAGDNLKFHFPMAFSTTMLAWGILEFGHLMGPDLQHALGSLRWGTDYFLKATAKPNIVYAGVGDPVRDHNCWERPEDMDTPRTTYVVTPAKPGSEVSGEIAAALAAASLAFASSDRRYSNFLVQRAAKVFQFADKYRGNYGQSLGLAVCPFYCGSNGYQDELIWAATWLYKATKANNYWSYVKKDTTVLSYDYFEFGWDAKHAGINILASKLATPSDASLFVPNANKFVCSILPESPTKRAKYTPGGLLFWNEGSNLQNAASTSFLMVAHAQYLIETKTSNIRCGNLAVSPKRLIQWAYSQVDYILGTNPKKRSYMVGYGNKFPQFIHHRGSSVPSKASHPKPIPCKNPLFASKKPNPNLLIGAVVGGPEFDDSFADSRGLFNESEPTTYINAPLVGTLAFLKSNPKSEMWSIN